MGHPRQVGVLGDRDPFSVRPGRSEWLDDQLAENLITDYERGRVLTNRLNNPGHIHAHYQWEGGGHTRRPGAVSDRNVHRVHTRRAHLDQHLPRSRVGIRNLHQGWASSILRDRYCSHQDHLANRSSKTRGRASRGCRRPKFHGDCGRSGPTKITAGQVKEPRSILAISGEVTVV